MLRTNLDQFMCLICKLIHDKTVENLSLYVITLSTVSSTIIDVKRMVCVRYLCKKANNASNAAYQLGFTDMQKLSSLNQLIVFILRLIYLVFNKKIPQGNIH